MQFLLLNFFLLAQSGGSCLSLEQRNVHFEVLARITHILYFGNAVSSKLDLAEPLIIEV